MSWSDQRVFVTGHTGFKGAWLTSLLVGLGAKVKGYALNPDTDPALFDQLGLKSEIDHSIGNINDRENLNNSISKFQPDVIFHLAAQSLVRRSYSDPIDTWRTNVQGTVNLLEAVRHLNKNCQVIIITTDKVYANDESGKAFDENSPLGGHDPYSASKAACELVVESYRKSFFKDNEKIRLASARAGNVIGGGDWSDNRIVPDIMRALSRGQEIEVRNPSAIRPWQHVLDPLCGYLLLAEKMKTSGAYCKAYNFGPAPSDQRPVKDLVEAVLRDWPGKWVDRSDPNALHEAGVLKLSIDQAGSELGWQPKWDFGTAIQETTRWYKSVHEGVSADVITQEQTSRFML